MRISRELELSRNFTEDEALTHMGLYASVIKRCCWDRTLDRTTEDQIPGCRSWLPDGLLGQDDIMYQHFVYLGIGDVWKSGNGPNMSYWAIDLF
jgi:hypothetical protein